MREQLNQAWPHSYRERSRDKRNPSGPEQARSGRQAPGQVPTGFAKSKRSVNLGRLAGEIGADVLGAALGLSDDALKILMDGRDHVRAEQYATHLAHKLLELGIPISWLERPYAPINPEHLVVLRNMAAKAQNKAPIRRDNFRRLAMAFLEKPDVLADALEMIPSSIANVAEGNLELDDHRFGHINPRLVRAGFPDGWLEESSPELTERMISALEQLATDDYERHLAEADTVQHIGSVTEQQPNLETSVLTMQEPAEQTENTMQKTAAQGQSASTTAQSHAPGGQAPLLHPMAAKGQRPVGLVTGRPARAPQKATHGEDPMQPAVTASQPTATAARRGAPPRANISKEASAARSAALEGLLDTARRGAKVTLWRDLLGQSLPYWGNIRRGAVLFRDDLAAGAEDALGLPRGWLDNPQSDPNPTLAAWVTDANVPLPQAASTLVAAVESQGTPATETPAAVTPAAIKQAAPKAKPAPVATQPVQAAAPVTVSAEPPQPAQPVAAAPAPAPVAQRAAPAAAGAGMEPGPLATALMAIIRERSVAGSLTESEALKLINSMMS